MGPPPARRKSAQPRKLPTKRASSDGGDERLKSAEAKASGLSQELERVREAASKEGEATRQKLQLTRDALERALRATAEADARKARRDVADAAFELGRATYVAGSLGGRDAWEDGDAARAGRHDDGLGEWLGVEEVVLVGLVGCEGAKLQRGREGCKSQRSDDDERDQVVPTP